MSRGTHVALCLFLALPRTARAADGGKNPALAQALFEEAQRLVRAGDFEQACPKFKSSYEADPGGGTLLNLADCYEKQGKLALAWSTFKEARVVAQRDARNERVEFADRHLQALEARLPRLTVTVPSPAPAGLTVSIDGVPLQEAAWRVALPIDPGSHVIRASAEGKQPLELVVEVPDGAKTTHVEVPKLAERAGEKSATAQEPEAPPTNGVSAESHATVAERGGTSSTRLVGWVVGGAGLVGIGVGSYFGVRAFSRWADRNDECPNGRCSQAAKDAGDEAGRAATISTLGFAAGLVATGVGALLVLTSTEKEPRAKAERTRVVPLVGTRSVGLEITRSW